MLLRDLLHSKTYNTIVILVYQFICEEVKRKYNCTYYWLSTVVDILCILLKYSSPLLAPYGL